MENAAQSVEEFMRRLFDEKIESEKQRLENAETRLEVACGGVVGQRIFCE
jgi:hypothetical protein